MDEGLWLSEGELTMKCDRFVFAHIKADVKWKPGKLKGGAATLKLKVYTEDDNRAIAELELGTLKADKTSEDCSTMEIELKYEENRLEDIFQPMRQCQG